MGLERGEGQRRFDRESPFDRRGKQVAIPAATVDLGNAAEDETEVSAIWTFTETGFHSVVAYDPSRDDAGLELPAGAERGDLLLVRARAEEDLTNLLDVLELPASRAATTPRADYPWRAALSRDEWSKFLATATEHLDYTNFKSRVQQRSGSHRHDLYMRVWSAMRGPRDPAASAR